jgi:hypothetical protein
MQLASIILNESLANQTLVKPDAHRPGFAASVLPTFQNHSHNITISGKTSAQAAPSACAPQEDQHG